MAGHQKARGFRRGMLQWTDSTTSLPLKIMTDETLVVSCGSCGWRGHPEIVMRAGAGSFTFMRCAHCRSLNLRKDKAHKQ